MLSLIQESPFLQLVVQVLLVLQVEIPGQKMVEVPEQLPVVVGVSMWKQPPPWLIMPSNTNANINAAGGVSPGFRHGTEGTVKILRPQVTSLVLTSGSLIIDTSQATITHSDGAFLSGTFEDRSYTHTDGTVYAYKVCVFTADEISLGSGVLVTLQGSNPLSLRTRNHGDFTLSTQLIANGSDGDNGSTDTPGKIGGYAGARKGSYNGYGPGKGANRQGK